MSRDKDKGRAPRIRDRVFTHAKSRNLMQARCEDEVVNVARATRQRTSQCTENCIQNKDHFCMQFWTGKCKGENTNKQKFTETWRCD